MYLHNALVTLDTRRRPRINWLVSDALQDIDGETVENVIQILSCLSTYLEKVDKQDAIQDYRRELPTIENAIKNYVSKQIQTLQ